MEADATHVKVNKEDDLSLYQQLRLLGKGGCAQVYLAKNIQSGRYVNTNLEFFCQK